MSTTERYCSTLQRTHSELYFENWKAERFSKTLTVIRFNLVQFSPSFLLNCCVSYMSLQCFERLFFILLSLVSSCQWKNSETVLSSAVERNLVLCNFWKKKTTLTFSSKYWLLTPILIIHTRQSIKSFSSLSSCRALVPAEDKLRTSLVAWTSTAGQGWALFGSCPRAAAAVHSE